MSAIAPSPEPSRTCTCHAKRLLAKSGVLVCLKCDFNAERLPPAEQHKVVV